MNKVKKIKSSQQNIIAEANDRFSRDALILTGKENAVIDHQKINILSALKGAKAGELEDLIDVAWLYYRGSEFKGNVLVSDKRFAVKLLEFLAINGNRAIRHNYAAMLREEGEFDSALKIIMQLVAEGRIANHGDSYRINRA